MKIYVELLLFTNIEYGQEYCYFKNEHRLCTRNVVSVKKKKIGNNKLKIIMKYLHSF